MPDQRHQPTGMLDVVVRRAALWRQPGDAPGPNVVHDPVGNWRYITGPGLDEPILAIRRTSTDTTELVRLDVVSDGIGQLVAIADSSGFINTTYAGTDYAQGPWASAGNY